MTHAPTIGLSVTAATAVVIAATTLAACRPGADEVAPTPPHAETAKVAVIIKGLDNPFFGAMKDGINRAAADSRAEVVIHTAVDIGDTVGQAAKLRALADQPRDCFLVNPITGENLVPSLREIAADGKPIVNIDRPVAPGQVDVATYIGTDNEAAGALAADALARAVGARGRPVALVGGLPDDVTSKARLEGFMARARSLGLRPVATAFADWDFEKAVVVGRRSLRATPDLAGFFAANDIMALGLVAAARTEGRHRVAIVGVDGILDALRAVADGTMSATVSQYPYVIGHMGLQACVAAARGHTLPRHVDAPLAVITRANAALAIQRFPQPTGAYGNPFEGLVRVGVTR